VSKCCRRRPLVDQLAPKAGAAGILSERTECVSSTHIETLKADYRSAVPSLPPSGNAPIARLLLRATPTFKLRPTASLVTSAFRCCHSTPARVSR
jgi:hypothetical protein